MVCKLYHLVHNLSYTASIFVLVLLAVERYLAVLHPIKCRAILRPARLKAAVACVWLAAAGLSASRLFWAQTVTVDLPGLFQVRKHKITKWFENLYYARPVRHNEAKTLRLFDVKAPAPRPGARVVHVRGVYDTMGVPCRRSSASPTATSTTRSCGT